MAGGITLNPVVIATLTGVGLILKAAASLKKYDDKTKQANFARIEYQKILDKIRFYLRGEAFDEKVFLSSLIIAWRFRHLFVKKYEETLVPL